MIQDTCIGVNHHLVVSARHVVSFVTKLVWEEGELATHFVYTQKLPKILGILILSQNIVCLVMDISYQLTTVCFNCLSTDNASFMKNRSC